MSCTSPMKLYKRDPAKFGGVAGMTGNPKKSLTGEPMTLNCGKCINCRLAYSREWALRIMHEVQVTDGECSFLTLTYDDEHLPRDYGLHYEDFKLFMYRVRNTGRKVRFFMCGEYGEETGRPHFHAVFFNCSFADKRFYKTIRGVPYYCSDELTKIWGNGLIIFSDVTLASAGYVARYNVKKVTGDAAEEAYSFVHPETGEVFTREPPFCQPSLKPGIGYDWFMRYYSDVFPCDFIVHSGKKFPVPRYYLKLYEQISAMSAEEIKFLRRRQMRDRKNDPEFSPRRLRDKDELSRLTSQQKRDMK
ncbi:VP4 [Kummerowia striata gokushovirus]|nr:VP4 [Kummerowia striata gokushovirus]